VSAETALRVFEAEFATAEEAARAAGDFKIEIPPLATDTAKGSCGFVLEVLRILDIFTHEVLTFDGTDAALADCTTLPLLRMLRSAFTIRQDAEVTGKEMDDANTTSFTAGDAFEGKMLSDLTWPDAELSEGKELVFGDLFTEVVLVVFI